MMTADRRVLLMKSQKPVSGSEFWVTPGGGLEPGESDEDALRREVAEETGARHLHIVQQVWKRQHDFAWNGREYSQDEAYYLVLTDPFDPVMDMQAAPGEASAFREFRWWSIDAIGRSGETFSPRLLHCLLERLSRNGPPDKPFAVGV